MKIRKRQTYLSTGSTLLNCAISDRPDGGFLPAKYYLIVGDSASGKTFFSMTCFAEAVGDPFFKDYRIIYDNVEDGMLMDVRRLFGAKVQSRLEPPSTDEDGIPVYSETVEEFFYNVDDKIQEGRPFIYVLDSMDGLETEDDQKKFDEHKEAFRKGKAAAGSYGMAKAKKNSVGIRKVVAGLRSSGSILIVISQTRDDVSGIGFGPRKTRGGGRALKFYATTEVWTSVTGAVSKTVRGKARKIGTKVRLAVKKNRVTGKLHDVDTVIFPSYGIDDVGSCVDFLVAEKWWKKQGKAIHAPELRTKLPREKLIQACEDNKPKLLQAVGACWSKIDKDSALNRSPRYE